MRAEAYAQCRARVRKLVEGATEAEQLTIVPACPDWNVRNAVAHVTGICVDLVAGNRPGDDTQTWVDAQVASRADVDVNDLLDEWDAASEPFERLIREKSPVGLGGLVYDAVAHEHDIAGALARPVDRDNTGIDVALEVLGSIVHGDLAANGLGAVVFGDGTQSWKVGEGEVGLRVTAPKYELTRFLGSRRSLDQMRKFDIEGDLDTYLPGLSHAPLPETDLHE
jgi:uncharacterized protein (TIGR03083 family)